MNRILEEVLRENENSNKRRGWPEFHSHRAPTRRTLNSDQLANLRKFAEARWPEYNFKFSSRQSIVTVIVNSADTDENLDTFKFRALDPTNMETVESPEGAFEVDLKDFLELAKSALEIV